MLTLEDPDFPTYTNDGSDHVTVPAARTVMDAVLLSVALYCPLTDVTETRLAMSTEPTETPVTKTVAED